MARKKAIPKDGSRIAIARVNPAKYNPRVDLKPSDPEYQAIKASIEEFGLVEALVWNIRTGNLVGGHQRLKILVEDGAKFLVVGRDVRVVDFDETAEKKLNLALNNGGAWDEVKLAAMLSELFESDGAPTDEAVQSTGFTASEVRDAFKFFAKRNERKGLGEEDDIRPEEFEAKNETNVSTENVCPNCGFEF